MSTHWLVSAIDDWRIPRYAQSMLWVRGADYAVQATGERGEFAVDAPGLVYVAWGTVDGPVLFERGLTVTDGSASLGWQGEVAIGGFVERLHALTVRGLEILVAEVEGWLLPSSYTGVPTLDQMQAAAFTRADDPPEAAEQHIYTVIVLPDTVLAEFLHHALVSELPVDCRGGLGPQDGRWHDMVGLPILLEAVTLLAPRKR